MTEIAERIAAAGTKRAFAGLPDPEPFARIADAEPSATKAAFYRVLQEMKDTHDLKGEDYGTDEDSFANVRSKGWGLPDWFGAANRATDKIQRMQSFFRKGRLANESIEDAFLDLAVYAAIGLCLYREGK